MPTYRGQDGSFALATVGVGEVESWQVTATMQTLETTIKGNVARTYRPGLGDGTGQAVVKFDYGDTGGQKVLIDQITNAVATVLADLRFALDEPPTKYFHGSAVVMQWAVDSPLDGLVMCTFQFQISGGLQITWAP